MLCDRVCRCDSVLATVLKLSTPSSVTLLNAKLSELMHVKLYAQGLQKESTMLVMSCLRQVEGYSPTHQAFI